MFKPMFKTFRFRFALLMASCLLTACEPGNHGHSHGGGSHSHEDGSSHSHEGPAANKPAAASRIGPHKGRVVTFAKVNWELAGGKETRLYLLDSKLKQRALKPMQAELVIDTPNGQAISKFTHAKDHLVAKVPYDPAKDSALVTMTVNGKTELIDFSQ